LTLPSPLSALRTALFAAASLCGVEAWAQSTSSVSGPVVEPGWDAEYRLGMTDRTAGDSLTHRFGLARTVSPDVRLRGLVAFEDAPAGDLELSYIEADILWQFAGREADSRYQSAVRLDVRRDELDDLTVIGLNWLNQWHMSEGWRLRLMGLVDAELGEGGADGAILANRVSLSRKLNADLRLGLDMYNSWGNTGDGFGTFDEQGHVAGVTLAGPAPLDLEWTVGALAGLSDAAPDHVLQFRLSRSFDATS